jgi:hypothetical protein
MILRLILRSAQKVILFSALGLLFSVLAEPTTDLGTGLAYFRLHSLENEAPALSVALAAKSALVLDVRYATASKDVKPSFRELLASYAGPAPLLVLVSPETPPVIAEALATAPTRSLVTLGVQDSAPAPAVIVEQTARTDRRAYDALEAGVPLAALIDGKIEKERYDEASLMTDFRNGNTNAEPPAFGGADDTLAAGSSGKKNPPAPEKAPLLTDRVLQRAVHLHRALAALQPRNPR